MNSIISRNAKTGYSINVHSCQPSPICHRFCYRMRRTADQAHRTHIEYGFDPGANSGPITWPIQQEAYRRNEAVIKQAAGDGSLEGIAVDIARFMENKPEHLRWCGTGDLFPELDELIVLCALHGVRSFGFSRKPAEMIRLASMLDDVGVRKETPERPHFTASTDSSYDTSFAGGCVLGSRAINGYPALAYATWRTGKEAQDEIEALPWRPELSVVFGLHSTGLGKTAVGHPLECPATAGSPITCVECRRCY